MEHTQHICTILDNLHKRLSFLERLTTDVDFMEDTPENNTYFFNIDLNDPLKRFVALNRVSLPNESRSWIISRFYGDYAWVEGNKMWSEHDVIYKKAAIHLRVTKDPENSMHLIINGSYNNLQGRRTEINESIEHTLLSNYITELIRDKVRKYESTS